MQKLLHVYQNQCLPFIGRTTLYLVNKLTINYRHMHTIICHDSSTARYKLAYCTKNQCVLLRISVIPFCWIETTLFYMFMLTTSSGVGRCLILGGPNFLSDIYMYTYIIMCTCQFFYVYQTQQKFLKLKFVLEPKKMLQKWLVCGSKNPFTQLKYL